MRYSGKKCQALSKNTLVRGNLKKLFARYSRLMSHDTGIDPGYHVTAFYTDKKENQIFLMNKEIQKMDQLQSYI
jgi:hypothetical protein